MSESQRDQTFSLEFRPEIAEIQDGSPKNLLVGRRVVAGRNTLARKQSPNDLTNFPPSWL